MDLNGFKTQLLNMPRTRLSEADAATIRISPVYTDLVNTRVSKIEVILKLVCIRSNSLDMTSQDQFNESSLEVKSLDSKSETFHSLKSDARDAALAYVQLKLGSDCWRGFPIIPLYVMRDKLLIYTLCPLR